jgi:hypothetical protein
MPNTEPDNLDDLAGYADVTEMIYERGDHHRNPRPKPSTD